MDDEEARQSERENEGKSGTGPTVTGRSAEADKVKALRDLLLEPEIEGLAEVRELVHEIQREIHDPDRLIQSLLPVIDEVLSRKVAESRDMVAKAIAPIIDDAFREKFQEEEASLPATLTPVIGYTLRQAARTQRDELADALAPVVGSSMRRGASAAMGAFVTSAERRLRRAFRLGRNGKDGGAEGTDKKAAGSEGEAPFLPSAVLLVHKASGALIAQAPPADVAAIDAETVPRILKKVHSRAGKARTTEKIPLLSFEDWTLAVEMAEHSYLILIMTEERPTPSYLFQVQQALTNIEHHYRRELEQDEGISPEIAQNAFRILDNLLGGVNQKRKKPPRPYVFGTLCAMLIVLAAIPISWHLVRAVSDRAAASRLAHTLRTHAELGRYPIDVQVRKGHCELSGIVDSDTLRSNALELARNAAGVRTVENRIAVATPSRASDTPIREQVARIVRILNVVEGVALTASCDQTGTVAVRGAIPGPALVERIKAVFLTIPNVRAVKTDLRVVDSKNRPGRRTAIEEISRICSILNVMDGVAIEPTLKEGELILGGRVPSSRVNASIRQLFSQIPGVRKVTSVVAIGNVSTGPSAWSQELPRLDAIVNLMEDVEVASAIENGAVLVKGRVAGPADEERIARLYLETLGTETITTDLRIEPKTQSTADRIAQTTAFLNLLPDVRLSTSFEAGTLTVDGIVRDSEMTEKIKAIFTSMPGVQSIAGTVRLKTVELGLRIEFDPASARLQPAAAATLAKVKQLLLRFPNKRLRIIGAAEIGRNRKETEKLADSRIRVVRDALVERDVDPQRLILHNAVAAARDGKLLGGPDLGRYVYFELVQ